MARLKGLSPLRVILRHALPNALAPIINVVALNLAYLITGVVVVEAVFTFPGLGRLMVDAVQNRDIAVVQGGLTTCMELTANRRPFLYVPLRNHFEQNFHVRHRLDRYGAGHCVTYDDAADPELLAGLIATTAREEVTYRPVETGGAARAADLLASLL